jgi:hypothetical protein
MPFGLFEKGADVTLTLDRPQGPYYPGDVVHATVSLQVDKPVKVREVRVVLIAKQSYKAQVKQEDTTTKETRIVDSMVNEEKEIDKQIPIREGTLNAGQTVTADLRIPADAVAPYHSDYIETHWLVKVTVDRPMAGDSNAEIELPLIVPAPGLYAKQGEFGNGTGLDVAALRFNLPKLEFVQGETLSGELIIEPRQDFEAREIRLELLHQEHISAGDQARDVETSDQKVQLAGTTPLTHDKAVRYDFSFAVAPKGQPTAVAPKGTSRWILKATVDRPWASDAEVTQEVYIYSGARTS